MSTRQRTGHADGTLPPLTPHGWLRWDVASRVFASVPRGASVLEIGAGQGAVGCRLARAFRYTGVELDEQCRRTAQRHLRGVDPSARVHSAIGEVPTEARFDVVCAFEVLEHIDDDVGALKEWTARLRPGGLLVLSVPLHQHRFGPSDVYVGHFRRYGREQLSERLRAVGLEDLVLVTYGLPLGNMLERARNEIVRRRAQQPSMADKAERTAESGRFLQPDPRLGAATRALTAPFRLAQRPFSDTALGTGLVITGRRPT